MTSKLVCSAPSIPPNSFLTIPRGSKSLVQKLTDSLITAQRDNDLIYHQDVPAPSGLEPIEGKGFVNAVVLLGLADPTTVVSGGDGAIFANLESWGVRTAIREIGVVRVRS
jgi:hypothetical protein